MSRTEVEPRRTIMWYFAALVVTVTVAMGLVLGLTFLRYEGEAEARTHLAEYHLRSLVVASEVSSAVADVSEIVATAEVGGDLSGLDTRRRLANSVFVVTDGIEDLEYLERIAGEREHVDSTVLAQAGEHAAELDLLVDDDDAVVSDWQNEIAALDLAMFQLRRLHAIEAETDLQEIEDRSDQVRLAATILVPLALLLGGAVVARLWVLVRRRLHDLDEANRRLVEARERIEQSQRLDALATLVGGVAHDFNNLLMVIALQAEVAEARVGPDGPGAEQLRRIRLAADQATNTTRQLLSFSRQDAAQPEIVDLNEHIHALQPVLRSLLRLEIDLRIDTADELGAVLVDPVQIDQVLMNLVLNARDAMPGAGQLSISTADVELSIDDEAIPAGSYSRIRVRDTGAGMAPEIRARVFEPFFTTKDTGVGAGLGLSMVHGIVTNCGGHIRVESTVGVGTMVELYLPHAEARPVETVTPPGTEERGGSETILVVEDEEQIRELLTAPLREGGYDVLAAADAPEAIELRRGLGRPIDLVLTDVVMPGPRGPELVAALREIDPEIVVVYMSGHVEDEALGAVLTSGDHFLAKPFEAERVMDAVRRGLDQRHPPDRAVVTQ